MVKTVINESYKTTKRHGMGLTLYLKVKSGQDRTLIQGYRWVSGTSTWTGVGGGATAGVPLMTPSRTYPTCP